MNYTNFIIEIAKLLATLSTVFLTAYFAIKKYQKELNDKKETIVNAIFGDLANIVQHYSISKNELQHLLSNNEKKLRLKFLEFGNLKSLEKMENLGNLSVSQIRQILQLNLRIRNTDMFIQQLIENNEISEIELKRLRSRLDLCINSASNVIREIVENRPSLKNEWNKIKY